MMRSGAFAGAAGARAAAAALSFSFSSPSSITATAAGKATAAFERVLAVRLSLIAAYSSTAIAKPAAAATENVPRPSAASSRSSPAKEVVPDVLVTFGNQADRMTFVSHPGVMAIAKLLEMTYLTEHRAVLTQENVEAIREYDEELATKAQLAVDSGLAVNFQKLDFFDRPEFVEMFRKEKKLLEQARAEVFAAPKGQYAIPACAANYIPVEIPRRWRPDLELTEEMVRVDPTMRAQTELRSLIVEHLSQTKVPKEALPSSEQQQQPKKQIS